ncbi:androgen-induced gene 1 protein-like [Topomyia yanbarensis]|uniref:androgen-induced gene 1 protein-like n=1 Tax=Topomyia yanbarensis TaxID=2498891 RepID=UPI00273C1E42|nr:androgen-induced gene 1 protein-like [Topomyia yanbarensis]
MADLRIFLHLAAAFYFYYSIYGFAGIEFPPDMLPFGVKFGGMWKYLTIWNAVLQAIYFTVALINDLIGTNEISPRTKPISRKLKDYLFATFVFPGAMLVAITFWVIMTIDRELMLPKALDPIFPNWLNHALHTNIVLFVLLEVCTSFRQYPSRKDGLTGILSFGVCYLAWLHVIRHYGGVWVYGVLEVLNLPMRIAFFAAILGLSVGLYLFGELFNNAIWIRELWTLRSATKKSK